MFSMRSITMFFTTVIGCILIIVFCRVFEWNPLATILALIGLALLESLLLPIVFKIVESMSDARSQEVNPKSVRSMIRGLREDPTNETALTGLENFLAAHPSRIKAIATLTAAYFTTSRIKAALDLLQECYEKTGNKKIGEMRQRLLSLEELELYGSGSDDWNQLALLTKLKKLYISKIIPEKEPYDFSPLVELPNLVALDLSELLMEDISSLANLTELTELNLSLNDIKDISPLERLIKLTKLDLSDNDIENVSSLSGLINLTSLRLGGNKISDADIARLKKKLPNCNVIT